ncbi:glycosyltransferase family 4 protein [Catalinimonas niigatensis]|uniref:glycosyltransferase family 4 protein n=1 Tax=Catalinimonas niigatensis TaxID=1397264 RepID=UPI0026651891|nr:glycosyltransferase family 4 protein [Catalinimonas niigatensis]WPP52901.1 glycosyltransferase family 4 protein [Catalinimonas niigatensis]
MSLKILFLSHAFYPNVGGIEVNAEILAQAFYEAGHEVRIVTWSKDSENKDFPYSVIRNPKKFELIQEHAWADVIFENNPCLRLSWPNILFNKPSVIALNTWVSRNNGTIGIQDRLKQAWFKRAKGIIAVSDAIRKRCWPKAIVIGNPYRIQVFSILPDIPRKKDFVFLGRLVSDKGADLAILALHQMRTSAADISLPQPRLTIIGSGPERGKLEKLVADLKLGDCVHFTGSLHGEKLNICLNQHRFLLAPSIWEEPFGNVALEGMACGCVPIVADGGGLPDAVGNAGLTFMRGNVDALVSSIKTVIQNPALEQRLRQEATIHLKAHHPDKVASQYLKVIEAAMIK